MVEFIVLIGDKCGHIASSLMGLVALQMLQLNGCVEWRGRKLTDDWRAQMQRTVQHITARGFNPYCTQILAFERKNSHINVYIYVYTYTCFMHVSILYLYV